MRETSAWSWNCGLWGGVRVYVHASVLVIFVLMVYLAGRAHLSLEFSWNGFIAVGMLSIAILIHELGHALATWRLGGTTDLIVLGPLGGMHSSNLPREPQREVAAALAGPLANLVGMVVCGPSLVMSGIGLVEILLQPLNPAGMLDGSAWIVAVKMLFWFNWLLLLVNLLPVVPLDGGRALRSVLWPVMGYRGAVRTVSRTGMLISLMVCFVALLVYNPADQHLMPTWLPLIMLAIYMYFTSRNELQRTEEEDEDDDLLGYDFSQGYTSLEQSSGYRRRQAPGPLRRWLRQRREAKQRRLREFEAEEERRFDEVLIRINEVGIDALSADERALLHRVSARYRGRLQS